MAIYITLGLTSALLIIHSKYYTLTNVKLVVIIIIALSVAVAFLVRLKNNTTKAIFIGIVVFVTTGLGKSMYSGGEYKYFYPTNPIIDRIQRTPGHFRSIAIMKNDLEAWGANINTFYDIEDVRNNDSIGITWYNKFVVNQIYEPDILNFLNVKYIVVPEGIYYTKILSNKEATFSHHYDIGMGMSVGSFKPVMEYNGFTLYENPRAFNRAFMVYDYKIADTHGEAFDLVRRYAPQIGRTAVISREAARYASFVPGDTMTAPASDVSFEEYAPNRIKMRVDTSSPGLLVISNTYFPGWHAYIDGRGTRVIRADYAFQGVFVPGGRHEVRLDYMPLSFVIGLILSLAGLAAIPLMYVLL
ncbi:MAG: YfhO family protein [Deltaproteobacteria bacterium]|nr:YfhO family protein [Deltaproteobacteria bacterium]